MSRPSSRRITRITFLGLLLVPTVGAALDPTYTADLGRDRCTFVTDGESPYFPLRNQYTLHLEGQEERDGALVDVHQSLHVLPYTERRDGARVRPVQKTVQAAGELRQHWQYLALCRETGDVWSFGTEQVYSSTAEADPAPGDWSAGWDGGVAGRVVPGAPLVASRYLEGFAPGGAEIYREIVAVGVEVTVPAGTFEDAVVIRVFDALDPTDPGREEVYAPGIGLIRDGALELVEILPSGCQPDDHVLCLKDNRFRVEIAVTPPDGPRRPAHVRQISNDSGEVWFFSPDNVELLVKALDDCTMPGVEYFWFFAAGLTNVEVEITVTDTFFPARTATYVNPQGRPFEPILDTSFSSCP